MIPTLHEAPGLSGRSAQLSVLTAKSARCSPDTRTDAIDVANAEMFDTSKWNSGLDDPTTIRPRSAPAGSARSAGSPPVPLTSAEIDTAPKPCSATVITAV